MVAKASPPKTTPEGADPVVTVRRLHRRDLNRTWEFLKHGGRRP